ncbi:hypothetical protein PLESTM_002033600 [Pleodorina starrii]|nr:hypothetical protein PLESTM_002033600 [Pleodorina starrii]
MGVRCGAPRTPAFLGPVRRSLERPRLRGSPMVGSFLRPYDDGRAAAAAASVDDPARAARLAHPSFRGARRFRLASGRTAAGGVHAPKQLGIIIRAYGWARSEDKMYALNDEEHVVSWLGTPVHVCCSYVAGLTDARKEAPG